MSGTPLTPWRPLIEPTAGSSSDLALLNSTEKTSFQIHVADKIHKIRTNRESRREAVYVIVAAVIIGLNTGFVNGATLSQAFLADTRQFENDRHHNPGTQMVAGLTASYTNNAIALIHINEDLDLYLYLLCMILSYMGGAMLVSFITPRSRDWMIEPRYGPTFFISGSLLLVAALLAHLKEPSRFIFFLATGSVGIQNGISSLFSANLIRCGLTGASTDMSLVIGKMLRGNFESFQRGVILALIVSNFWIGSLLSVPVVERISFQTLFIPAVLLYSLGALATLYLTERLGVPFWSALIGNWEWPLVLDKIRPGETEWTMEDWMQIFEQADVDCSHSVSVDDIKCHLEKTHGVQMSDFQLKVLFRAAKVGNREIREDEWRRLGYRLDRHKFLHMRQPESQARRQDGANVQQA